MFLGHPVYWILKGSCYTQCWKDDSSIAVNNESFNVINNVVFSYVLISVFMN